MTLKLLLPALLLMSGEIIAQKVVFDINGRVNFTQPGDYTDRDTFQSSSYQQLDDTTWVRTYSTLIGDNIRDYHANTGYEFNGLFTVKLSDRFTLRTGMGLQFGSHSVGSDYKFVSSTVDRRDTLYQENIGTNPGGGISSCDCYENTYSDVSEGISDRVHQEMINLSIPADIGYDIIPGKLSIRAGAYFHTPLYAASERSYITVERIYLEDMTKCKWVRVDEKNTATTGVSNFQWGVSSWLNYEILPNLRVEVGVRQQVNDMYVKEGYQFFSFDSNSFKPLTFSAGLSYRLSKGVSMN